MLGFAAHEPNLTGEQRRWRRERRSAWLRLVVLVILVVNLGFAGGYESVLVHANVALGYGIATLLALALAELRRGPTWFATVFVVLDALTVVVLFHEHLFAPGRALDHNLTAPSLAIGFVLLTHVALRLQPRLVLLFSGLVIAGWLSLLAVAVEAHLGASHTYDWPEFLTEGALAAAFAFAAFVCWLLTNDHNVLLKSAVASEGRRSNLSRFFSPSVLSELETTGASLSLSRRRVAVMFVDLRSFTRLSETMAPEQVAELLAEYRELVTQEVFAHGGMIDKFIGDGVMAVFGQPRATPGDGARAFECAVHLSEALSRWKEVRSQDGRSAPEAGIGLHAGMAIGGVLQSGSHDEFTLFGDAVNVAQRLERLCKTLNASIVVSKEAIAEAGALAAVGQWHWVEDIELDGRAGRMCIAYRPCCSAAETKAALPNSGYESSFRWRRSCLEPDSP